MGHSQNPMVKQPLYCDIQLKLLFHWTADFKKKKKDTSLLASEYKGNISQKDNSATFQKSLWDRLTC